MLFHKKNTQKRQRDGYDPSLGQGLYKSNTVSGFLHSKDPMTILAEVNELKFDKASEPLKTFSATTAEVLECFKDIKVLGKSELRNLLRWRTAVKKQIKELAGLSNIVSSTPEEEQDSDEKNEISTGE